VTERRRRGRKYLLYDTKEKKRVLEIDKGKNYIAIYGELSMEDPMDMS